MSAKLKLPGAPPKGGMEAVFDPHDLGPLADLIPCGWPGYVIRRCDRVRMIAIPRYPALSPCATPQLCEPCNFHATFPVLREDQWERFQEGYAPSLAFPPHIPPQGGGGLYLGSNGRSEALVSCCYLCG